MGEDRKDLAKTAIWVASAVFLLAWAGIEFTRANDRIAAVWLANGVTLAALLRSERRTWALLLGSAYAANVLANLASGDTLGFAASLASCNQLEVLIAAGLIAPLFDRTGRFDHRTVLTRFLAAAGIAAPAVSAVAATVTLWALVGADPNDIFLNWMVSDSLGLLIVTPLALSFRREDFQGGLREIAISLVWIGGAIGVTLVLFGSLRQPLLFSLTPLIVFAALRLRMFAVMVLIMAVAAIATVMTLDGQGVIAATNVDPTTRMYVLQAFIAGLLFTALPLRALVGERDRFGLAAAESDRLFRRIAEASPAGILHLDASGHPTFANARWTELTGQRFDDVGADRWIDIVDRSFRGEAKALWSRARGSDCPLSLELPYWRKGQRAGWAELNIYPEIEVMRLIGFVVRLTDQSERRAAAAALQEREALFRLVTDNAHDIIVRVDRTGRITFISQAVARLVGHSPEYLEGKSFATLLHPDDEPRIERLLSEPEGAGDEPVVQFRVSNGDGEWVWMEASYRLLALGEGLVLTLRDIEKRRELELAAAATAERLAESNRLLTMAEELAQVGHWRFGLLDQRLECSSGTAEIIGLDVTREANPVRALANLHGEDRPKLLRMIATVLRRREPADMLVRILTSAGTVRYVRIGVQADEDEAGNLAGLFGIVRDKTEFIVAQNELVRARDAAEAAASARSNFLATMSHEIRTPMTGVLGMIDLLQNNPGADERDRYFATLKQSADLLMAVLDDVLDFAKIESGAVRLEEAGFDIEVLLASTVDLFGNAASRKGLLLSMDSRLDGPAYVRGDPVRLQQVISNLLNNAIKFTRRGRVTATLRDGNRDDGQRDWWIEVRDTGIGIKGEEIDRLFDPFTQAENANDRTYGGTGLGLSISRRLVEAMGGEMGVDSTFGRGSTFWFRLRLPDSAPIAAASSSRSGARCDRPEGRSLRILAAEDNPVNQLLIGALLRKMGHRPTIVANGRLAVEAAQADHFDCVLMDMQMPEMDGLAATRAIRASAGPCAAVPIVALTADASPERRRFYDGAGLSDFLTKPIDGSALATLLQTLTTTNDRPIQEQA